MNPIELNREYYLNHLKKTNTKLLSKFSILGAHHRNLNKFIQREITKLKPKSKILDGGCGLSIWVTKLIRKNYQLKSMDCQPASIKFCKTHFKDKRYFLGSLYKIPLPKNSIDAVVLREVIEHIKNPDRALKEIFRVLKKNGLLILTTPNYSSPLLFFVENIYNRFFSEIKPYLNDVHPSKFKYKKLKNLLSKYSKVIHYSTIDFLNICAVAKKQ